MNLRFVAAFLFLVLAGCAEQGYIDPISVLLGSPYHQDKPLTPPVQPVYPVRADRPVLRPVALSPTVGKNHPVTGAQSSRVKSNSAKKYACKRKYCRNIRSCDEAYYLLKHCGMRNLDRDHDGVPCENICPGG